MGPSSGINCISIHALLAESDEHLLIINDTSDKNFYPRSPCGERPVVVGPSSGINCISIHALLAESDLRETVPRGRHIVFLSTLSLRRATTAFSMYGALPTFLSTLSLRRATWYSSASSWLRIYFYPRSPCGERRAGKESTC